MSSSYLRKKDVASLCFTCDQLEWNSHCGYKCQDNDFPLLKDGLGIYDLNTCEEFIPSGEAVFILCHGVFSSLSSGVPDTIVIKRVYNGKERVLYGFRTEEDFEFWKSSKDMCNQRVMKRLKREPRSVILT